MTKQTKRNILLVSGGVVAGASVPVGITIANSVKKEKESQVRSFTSVYSDKEINSAISSEVANYYASNPSVGKNPILETQVQERVKRQVMNLGEVSEEQLRGIINSEVTNVFAEFANTLDKLMKDRLLAERNEEIDIIFNSYTQIYDNLDARIDKAVKDNQELAEEGKWIVDWEKHASMRPKLERKDIVYKEQLTKEIEVLKDISAHFERIDDIKRWAQYDYGGYKQQLAVLQYDDIAQKVKEVLFDLDFTYADVVLEPEIEKEIGSMDNVNIPANVSHMTDQEKHVIVDDAKVWLSWAQKKIEALRNQKFKDGIIQKYPNKVIEEDFNIPSWVTRIPFRTFSEFTFKKRLYVPEGVQVVGREAFYKARLEHGIYFHFGLREIEEAGMAEAYIGNDDEAFRIPASVEKLGTRAFAYTELPKYFTTYGYLGEPTSNVFEDSLKFNKNKFWVSTPDIGDERFRTTAEKVSKETGKPVDVRRWYVSDGS